MAEYAPNFSGDLKVLSRNVVNARDSITALIKDVEKLTDELTKLDSMSKIEILSDGGINKKVISNYAKELKQLADLKQKAVKAQEEKKVGNSTLGDLRHEYKAINSNSLHKKMNEQVASDELRVYVDYKKALDGYLSKLINKMMGDDKNYRDIGDYFRLDTKESIRPFGLSVRKAGEEDVNIKDSDERVKFKNTIIEANIELLDQLGEEAKDTILGIIKTFKNIKSAQEEMGSTSALNRTSPRRFMTKDNEISNEYKDILALVDSKDEDYIDGVNSTKVSYKDGDNTFSARVKQLKIPEGDRQGLYEKTNVERLKGYTDEDGEHPGYEKLGERLTSSVNELIRAFSKASNFAPRLASENVKSGVTETLLTAGYTGTDLAKRMSYADWYENSGEEELDISKMPVTAIKSIEELSRSEAEIRGALNDTVGKLPNSYDKEYRVDPLKGRRVGDQLSLDMFGDDQTGIDNLDVEAQDKAVKYSANIRDNMSEAEKKAAEAAASIKNIVSEKFEKTGLLSSLVNDDEQRSESQYKFAGGATSKAYRSSSVKSGAVNYWGEARDQVNKLDNKQKEIEESYKAIEELIKSGQINKLVEPVSEFESQSPVDMLSSQAEELMKMVQNFDKGSYAESASTPGRDGTVLFDKQKYVDFVNNMSKSLKDLQNTDQFKGYGVGEESLNKISANMDTAVKAIASNRKAEVSNKLNDDYVKNALKENFLEKEISAREENIGSGLLAGADLKNAQTSLEKVKVELEGARNVLKSIQEEAAENNISIEESVVKASRLKGIYQEIAQELGSTAEADKFFGKVRGLSQITEVSVSNIAESFGGKLSGIDIDGITTRLKGLKNDLKLLSGGGYERSLQSSLRGSKGLSRAEQEPIRYSNEAIKEQINNARFAMTGSNDAFIDVANNINADELRAGIDRVRETLNDTDAKIEELTQGDTTGSLRNNLINLRDRLGKAQIEFDTLTQSLNDNSGIGQLRAVFESSKTLANSLNTLNAQVDLAVSNAKTSETSSKLNTTKNYVKNQETLTGNKMPLQDQLQYYKSALDTFKQGSDEYIAVLAMQRDVEQKINDQSVKSQQDAVKSQQDAAKRKQDAIKSLFDTTKSYVADQEVLTGQPMSFEAQAEYYGKQLPKFAEGTREYIEVLRLKQNAEGKAAEATERATERERQAQLDAVNAAKQRVNSVLNVMRTLASGMNNAVNKIVSIIRTGISIINRVVGGAVKFVNIISRGIKGIIQLFGNLGNRVKASLGSMTNDTGKATNGFNLLKGSATELRSKIMLLNGAFNQLYNNAMVKKAENLMASVYSLQNITGKMLTQDVLDWAKGMEYAFGLSARDLIGDINELTGVLYGLGMSYKDTALASENVLMISRYLAFMGAAGGDVKLVMDKMVSGLKGMTQAIDDLGLSVRVVQMDDYLKSLKAQGGQFANIATDFSSLNEQAKVYVRYAALIDQFNRNYDMSTFADALTTVTGRMQLLKQSVSSLITTLGTGFAKVLANLATYIIPVIKLLETLVTKIFAFFGIDVSLTTDINEGTSALGDLNDGLDDTKDKLDNVSDSAKKAGGNLQGFDRINNVTSSKSDGASDKDAFDYSSLMGSVLDELNKLASEASVAYSDKLLENLKNKLNEMRDAFISFAKDITGRDDFDLGFNWNKIKYRLQTILKNIGKLIESWGSFVIEIGLKFIDDVNIGLLATKLTELLAKISELAVEISNVLIPAFRAFYDIALSPIVKYIGESLVKAIDFIIAELDKWIVWFEVNGGPIVRFFIDLAEVVNAAWEVIRPFLDAGWGLLAEQIVKLGDSLREAFGSGIVSTSENKPAIIEWIQTELPGIIAGALEKLNQLWGALSGQGVAEDAQGTTWGTFLSIISNLRGVIEALIPIVIELVSAFSEFAKNELLPWINEKLGQLADWLTENKDSITEFLEKLGGLTWEGFTLFVDLIGKLIDYVVNNPEAVATFLKTLLGIKIGSWALNAGASLGFMLTGLSSMASQLPAIGTAISGGLATIGSAIGASGVGSWGASLAATFGAGGLGEVLAAFAGPIALVVAAIVGLVAAFKDLWDTSEGFRKSFSDMGNSISEHWQRLKDAFGEESPFGDFIAELKEFGDKLKEIYEKTLKPVLSDFFELLGGEGTTIINTFLDLLTLFINLGSNLLTGLAQIVNGILDLLIGLFTLDPDRILEGLKGIGQGLVTILMGIPQLIIDTIATIGSAIVGTFATIGEMFVDGLGEGIRKKWDGFIKWLDEKWDALVKKVKDFFGIHSPSTVFAEIGDNIISGLWQGIQDAWDGFITFIDEKFGGVVDTVKNAFNGIGDFFSETFTNAKNLAVNAWDGIESKFSEIREKVTGAFANIKDNISGKFTEAKEAAVGVWGDAKEKFSGVASDIASGLGTLKDKAKEIFKDVKKNANEILGGIGEKISNTVSGVKTSISNGWNYITGKTNAGKARKITTHAVGGSIAGGQLFIANEGGVPELIGNIDGTGKTNVANNNMIVQAMQGGIFEGVYNAMAEVYNQRGGAGLNNGNTTIKIDGFGLIDASTLRELARLIAPYINSNNINIADTGFSI